MDTDYGPDSVGITSTIPVEILFAAGLSPVDLNNRFIMRPDRAALVTAAEAAGFPINFCAWIKGIYGLVRETGIRRVIGVTQGDCSNTHLLMEILEDEGVEVIPFEYPYDRDRSRLASSMERFAARLGTTLDAAEAVRADLEPLRRKLERLDEMTWREGKVSGFENHLWLINSSDMSGDRSVFERDLGVFLAEAEGRPANHPRLRLGFLGIPPIVERLHDRLAERGAGVVYNEFQRQFSMPGEHPTLVDQYLAYTYPYRTAARVADIERQTHLRDIDAHVHYIQSFCYRQLEDRMIRRRAGVPVLALEFDRPGGVDARSLTRIEAFLELVEAKRREDRAVEGGA